MVDVLGCRCFRMLFVATASISYWLDQKYQNAQLVRSVILNITHSGWFTDDGHDSKVRGTGFECHWQGLLTVDRGTGLECYWQGLLIVDRGTGLNSTGKGYSLLTEVQGLNATGKGYSLLTEVQGLNATGKGYLLLTDKMTIFQQKRYHKNDK